MNVCKDRFKGKIAVITGGGSGIGKAIAERYIAEGGKVGIVDYSAQAIEDAVGEFGAEYACGATADVSKSAEVFAAVDKIMGVYGHIDSLFACAGITYRCPVMDLEEAKYQHVMDVNVNGTLNSIRAVAQKMIDTHTEGSIVTFSSMDAFICAPTNPSYSISKGAIVSMTRSLGVSLIRQGIRVNCLAPGFTETPFTAVTMADPEKLKVFTQNIPIDRVARPEEQVAPALFLASDDASYVVGTTLIVDGGSVVAH